MAGFLPQSGGLEVNAQDKIKKKLLEQDLLQTAEDKKETEDKKPAGEQKKETGYQEGQRSKMDELFKEPASQ